MAVSYIPEQFHSLTPFLMVKQADKVIDFLKEAFDAKEISRMMHPGGTVWHAQLKIGNSMIMLGDVMDEHPPMQNNLYLYVPDADTVYKKSVAAGAQTISAPADQFYGDRNAGIKDLAGNVWWIATHIEDVSDSEMKKRTDALLKKSKAA